MDNKLIGQRISVFLSNFIVPTLLKQRFAKAFQALLSTAYMVLIHTQLSFIRLILLHTA